MMKFSMYARDGAYRTRAIVYANSISEAFRAARASPNFKGFLIIACIPHPCA
jgi:hypothetical protein